MILPLDEAKEIDGSITAEDLEAIEISIRELTNNKFQNTRIRYKDVVFISDYTISVGTKVQGLKEGDTIEINYSGYNDGLYTVAAIEDDVIIFSLGAFSEIDLDGAMITKIEYPADIKRGVKKMLQYDKKMGNKLGIKSESYARMSVTYHDLNADENIEGYPSSLLSFTNKYEKMRW